MIGITRTGSFMPKRLNRPTNAPPPYFWREYIEGLEDKIHRQQVEIDKLQAKLQQPSLLGGVTSEPEVMAAPESSAMFEGMEPDQNRLGGFTADSEESRKAALGNYPKSGNQRHRILLYVFRQASHGATFDECREKLGIYSSDRRISELVEGEWLERTGRARRTTHGEDASVVVATTKAVEWIRTHDPQAFAEATVR
jgi:hypothetical protein